MARKAISKKLRFEVFKRDSFTCQYCGKSAPDVVLNVDHIDPVARGGGADILNLITSCFDCNSGKSDGLLSEHSMLEKQKVQLKELNERREQLKLMVEWRKGLLKLDNIQVQEIEKIFNEYTGHDFTVAGRSKISKLIKKYGIGEVMESMTASLNNYFKEDDEGSISKAFNYVARICACRQREIDEPHLKDLYYIRGIVRNRMYCNDHVCMDLLKRAYNADIPIQQLKALALESRHWTDFRETLEDMVF